MSVNPLKLATASPDHTTRTPCSKCGAPTFTKSGVCRACKNGQGLPEPKTLSTERIASYMVALRAELSRRQAEIAAALGEP